MYANERQTGWTKFMNRINGPWHKPAMAIFVVVVLAHWAEHLVQAFQVWGLHWHRHEALGILGLAFPALVESEWLHYLYALVMMAGFIMLRPAYVGRGRFWWDMALWIQVWHHFEHFLLLLQVSTGIYLGGGTAPTSILQLIMPRMELHLFYNAVVTFPMVVAAFYHVRPPRGEAAPRCTCSLHRAVPGAHSH